MKAAKLRAVHANVANAPKIIPELSTEGCTKSRFFFGSGNPNYNGTSTPLLTGNGKYNGVQSGFVISGSVFATGSGYVIGDILTGPTGTGITTAIQVTIDLVDASGAILNWHVSRIGIYTAYGTNPATMTGGSGTGATFNLNYPAPDHYYDITNPSQPTLYVCTTAGSKTTSVWVPVSGSAQWFKVQQDLGSSLTCFSWDGTTLGSTNVYVAKMPHLRKTIASDTKNGTTYTYSYASGADATTGMNYWQRTVQILGVTKEVDDIDPPYLFNQEIYAIPIPGIFLDGNICSLLVIDARAWASN